MKHHVQHCASLSLPNIAAGNAIRRICDCDGYHTFTELYDHRITLFIALCRHMHELLGMEEPSRFKIWRSKRHSDGELCFGTGSQFVMGIGTEAGKQITYHIPKARWSETDFFTETLDKAPEWDMHTSDDVLQRLKQL